MTLEEDYMWITGDAFSDMRVLIEGAIILYENDTGVLSRLAAEAEAWEAHSGINDIGSALYALRKHIRRLQEEHRKEEERHRVDQNPCELQ